MTTAANGSHPDQDNEPAFDTGLLQQQDRQHIIHPSTQLKEQEQGSKRIMVRGEGCTVWDTDGNAYLDGIAGLWLVNVGYGRKEIADVIAQQAQTLHYYPLFFGFSNQPAITLAARLADLAPGNLNHVLFASGGSEANEAAIKMARMHFHLQDQPHKKKIIARRQAYHGVTHAAGSATGLAGIRYAADPLDPAIVHIEPPGDIDDPQALRRKIEDEGPETVAAYIAEPVLGVGGIHVPSDDYYQKVRAICDEYNVLFIADEVITGFGRLGTMFGIDRWGVVPDLMTVAKGINSGYVPLGATLVGDHVYDVLKTGKKFTHGHTYAGHPAACQAALVNLEILKRENLLANAIQRGDQIRGAFRQAGHPLIDHVRGTGLICAVALKQPVMQQVHQDCLEHGLIIRALTDTDAGISPPLVINEEEANTLVQTVLEALDRVQV